jgi:hypothetical protein
MVHTLESALETIRERQQKGHSAFYRPLAKEASKIVREHYRHRLSIPEFGGGEEVVLKNECGTVIATGYRQVIIGDYGAFVEFAQDQLVKESIGPKFPGIQKKDASYLWYETKDAAQTKVYLQQHRVTYANYSPGRYYVSPDDVFIERIGTNSEWRSFTRIAHLTHTLEARRAVGGEAYGHESFKLVAKPGQWLCRNPENDYTWTCGDKDFGSLYRPLFDGRRTSEPKVKKARGETKNRKKLAETETAAAPANDCGPLFDPPKP